MSDLAVRLNELMIDSMPGCKVSKILARLNEEDRAALELVLNQKKSAREYAWSANNLAKFLTGEGYSIGHSTVRDHRLGYCSCVRHV